MQHSWNQTVFPALKEILTFNPLAFIYLPPVLAVELQSQFHSRASKWCMISTRWWQISFGLFIPSDAGGLNRGRSAQQEAGHWCCISLYPFFTHSRMGRSQQCLISTFLLIFTLLWLSLLSFAAPCCQTLSLFTPSVFWLWPHSLGGFVVASLENCSWLRV